MSVSTRQAWAAAGDSTVVSTRALAYASSPAANSLLVAFSERGGLSGIAITIADDMTDGGTWTEIKHTSYAGGNSEYGWWKIVGANANTNKTLTVSTTTGAPLIVYSAEYLSTIGSITWNLNGVAQVRVSSSTNPTTSTISIDSNPSVGVSYVSHDATTPTASSGYTRRVTNAGWNFGAVEDKTTSTVSTAEIPNWSSATGNWMVIAAVFEATPSSAANRIRFPATTEGMGSGGMTGGGRVY